MMVAALWMSMSMKVRSMMKVEVVAKVEVAVMTMQHQHQQHQQQHHHQQQSMLMEHLVMAQGPSTEALAEAVLLMATGQREEVTRRGRQSAVLRRMLQAAHEGHRRCQTPEERHTQVEDQDVLRQVAHQDCQRQRQRQRQRMASQRQRTKGQVQQQFAQRTEARHNHVQKQRQQ